MPQQHSTAHQGLTWVTFGDITVVPSHPGPGVLGVAPDPPPRGRVPAVVAFLVGVACLGPDLALEASLRDGSSAGVVLALGAGLLASSAWGGRNVALQQLIGKYSDLTFYWAVFLVAVSPILIGVVRLELGGAELVVLVLLAAGVVAGIWHISTKHCTDT